MTTSMPNEKLFKSIADNNFKEVERLIKTEGGVDIGLHLCQSIGTPFTQDTVKPIHVAISNKRVEIAKFLIENGADVNAKDLDGNTPLFLAVKLDQTEVAKFLIENGADTTIKNNAGLDIRSIDKSSLSSEMQDLVDFEERRIPLKLAIIANRKIKENPNNATVFDALTVVNKHRYGFFKKDENRPSKSLKNKSVKLI